MFFNTGLTAKNETLNFLKMTIRRFKVFYLENSLWIDDWYLAKVGTRVKLQRIVATEDRHDRRETLCLV